MNLKDRVAFVTGAGRGIGRAISLALAREGCAVALQGKTKKNLERVEKELKPYGGKTAVLAGDVSDEGSVARCASAAEQQLGPIDILVNNAGIFALAEVDKCDTAVFDRVLAVNLRGPFLMSRAFLPGMRARRRGHIVNIASTAGKRGFAGGGAYCASKFGLVGLSQSLLYEARKYDVRVTCVFPSTVSTEMTARAGVAPGNSQTAIQPEDIAEAVVAALKMEGRAMTTSVEIWQTNPA